MNKLRNIIVMLLCCFALPFWTVAQNTAVADSADLWRSNGKIWVVIAVSLIILIGLFLYVYLLDRKVTKLENEINKNQIN